MESAWYGIYALVVFVSEILLVRCAHSFDFWYVNNSCVNTVRQHFPWSILYSNSKLEWGLLIAIPSLRELCQEHQNHKKTLSWSPRKFAYCCAFNLSFARKTLLWQRLFSFKELSNIQGLMWKIQGLFKDVPQFSIFKEFLRTWCFFKDFSRPVRTMPIHSVMPQFKRYRLYIRLSARPHPVDGKVSTHTGVQAIWKLDPSRNTRVPWLLPY